MKIYLSNLLYIRDRDSYKDKNEEKSNNYKDLVIIYNNRDYRDYHIRNYNNNNRIFSSIIFLFIKS